MRVCGDKGIFKAIAARGRRFRARAKASGGFTLTEALATVIVVGLVSAAMVTAVTVGVQQYNRSMALSEAQQLYSSLSRLLDTDLRNSSVDQALKEATDVVDVTGYQSKNFGNEMRLQLEALDDNDEVAMPTGRETTGFGQLALCSFDGDAEVENRLLGDKAYNRGLRAKVKSFTYNPENRYYSIELVVGIPGTDDEELVDQVFSTYALRA